MLEHDLSPETITNCLHCLRTILLLRGIYPFCRFNMAVKLSGNPKALGDSLLGATKFCMVSRLAPYLLGCWLTLGTMVETAPFEVSGFKPPSRQAANHPLRHGHIWPAKMTQVSADSLAVLGFAKSLAFEWVE